MPRIWQFISKKKGQLHIDAAIQPGNSGGPIVDDKGNAVAVAVAKLDLKKIYKDFSFGIVCSRFESYHPSHINNVLQKFLCFLFLKNKLLVAQKLSKVYFLFSK